MTRRRNGSTRPAKRYAHAGKNPRCQYYLTLTVTCLNKEIESVLDAEVPEDDSFDGTHAEIRAGIVVGVIEVRLEFMGWYSVKLFNSS